MSDTIIVVDTNIIISALVGAKGASRKVIRSCLTGLYRPLISNALFHEYEDVSQRERIQNICPLSNSEIQELLNAFYSVCDWIPIYYLWRPNSCDEGDNFLVELAIAGNASYIVTNNINDLNDTELHFPNIQVITPEQMLKEE